MVKIDLVCKFCGSSKDVYQHAMDTARTLNARGNIVLRT